MLGKRWSGNRSVGRMVPSHCRHTKDCQIPKTPMYFLILRIRCLTSWRKPSGAIPFGPKANLMSSVILMILSSACRLAVRNFMSIMKTTMYWRAVFPSPISVISMAVLACFRPASSFTTRLVFLSVPAVTFFPRSHGGLRRINNIFSRFCSNNPNISYFSRLFLSRGINSRIKTVGLQIR